MKRAHSISLCSLSGAAHVSDPTVERYIMDEFVLPGAEVSAPALLHTYETWSHVNSDIIIHSENLLQNFSKQNETLWFILIVTVMLTLCAYWMLCAAWNTPQFVRFEVKVFPALGFLFSTSSSSNDCPVLWSFQQQAPSVSWPPYSPSAATFLLLCTTKANVDWVVSQSNHAIAYGSILYLTIKPTVAMNNARTVRFVTEWRVSTFPLTRVNDRPTWEKPCAMCCHSGLCACEMWRCATG